MSLIIGHRGAVNFAKENTIASIEKSISLGCYSVEIDVRLSKDNYLIIFHDATTRRMTGKQKYIRDLTLKQIKLLDPEIPTLQEVIDICKKLRNTI